jgi:predicted DNA-binding antitoxin AbrB/MazE fold protein
MYTLARAVYENGVLRLDRPLPFAEGAEIDVLVSPAPVEDEVAMRIRSAKSLEELFAIADSLPPDGEDEYDIVAALEENRRWSAGWPVDPPNDQAK